MSYERGTSLRFLRIREEEVYATSSSRPLSTHPYVTFSTRSSAAGLEGGMVHIGGRGRNSQLTLPMLLHDRYRVDFGSSSIDAGFAQRQLWNTVFERTFNPTGVAAHSRRGPGDLKSWSLDGIGPNPKDSRVGLGMKCSGFNLNSQRKNRADLFQLSIQYLLATVEDSTYDPGDDDELWPDVLYSHYFLQSTPIRVKLLPDLVASDLAGTRIEEPTKLSISVTRKKHGGSLLGGAPSGDVLPLEPHLVGTDRWQVTITAPTFDSTDHVVAQGLVTALRSPASDRGRYDLRIDLGGMCKTMYRAEPMTAAIRDELEVLWGIDGADFDPDSQGITGARVYRVFGEGTDINGVNIDQYVPTVGNTIRFQGWKGGPHQTVEGQGGGYVARVADGKVDSTGRRVSFYFEEGDLLHTTGDERDQLVPGGIAIHLKGAVLTGGEGLGNEESSQSFTFMSDSETTVEVKY